VLSAAFSDNLDERRVIKGHLQSEESL